MAIEGERLLRLGQLEAAERQFRNALALDPRNYSVLNALGLVALERGDAAGAIALLKKACDVSPDQPTPHVNLGSVLGRLGRYSEAIRHFDAALRLRPKDVEALYNRSTAYLHTDQAQEAFDGYRRVLEIVPSHADALFNLAVAAQRLGRFDELIDMCQRLLRLSPNNLDVLVMRIRALTGLGRTDEARAEQGAAIKAAERAIEAARSDAGATAQTIVDLGRALLDLGEDEQALALLDRALRKIPTYPDLFAMRGLVLAGLMRQAEAVESYDRALALRSGMTEALTHRGIALFQLGKFEAAIESYDRALQTGQGAPTVLINLVGAKKFESRSDPHLKTIEMLAANPQSQSLSDQMYLHFAAGKAFNDLGRFDEAFDHWLFGNRIKRQSLRYDVQTDVALAEDIGRELNHHWLAERRRLAQHQDQAPIFVFGMPRSGTTLVEQLIAGHPETSAIGETGFFRVALREALKSRPAHATFIEKVRSLSREELARTGEAYMQLARQRGASGSRLIDKTLYTSHDAPLIAAALPGAIFIHVRREPLDNCLACFSNLFTAGHEFTYDLEELATYRLSYDAMTSHWRQVLSPGQLLEIDYESLVQNFEAEARQIIRFCGLSWNPSVLEFSKVQRPVRSASAYQVRQGLFSSSVGRWRNYRAGLISVERILSQQGDGHAVAR